MTYIFEMLDQAAARQLSLKVRQPVYAFQRWQVIDRSRDIVLADLGGDGSNQHSASGVPSYYNLIWLGIPIAFSCRDTKQFTEHAIHVEITVEKMQAPSELQPAVEEIKNAICEAMEVYWGTRMRRVATVHAHFPAISFY